MKSPAWRFSLMLVLLGLGVTIATWQVAAAQEQSVRPGINKSYEKLTGDDAVKRFETESREIYRQRGEIVAACQLKSGMDVADVGAGSGLFTRLMAAKVQPGKVFAVDITRSFVEHVEKTCHEEKLDNVRGIVCTPTSTELPAASIDLAFLCDVYHHLEYPQKSLASIHQALRPGGRLVVVDFRREKGVSPDWIMSHVRADKKTVIEEVTAAGFKLIDEPELMKEQYVLRFQRVDRIAN